MMAPGSAAIDVRAPFFDDNPGSGSKLRLLSSIIVKYKLTADQPLGDLGKPQPVDGQFQVFVHKKEDVNGPKGHKGRTALIGQRGLFNASGATIPAGTPLLVYSGVICADGSRPCRHSDRAGSTFIVDWPPGKESYVLAPDEGNIAKFANDAALNLNAARNHTAALDVNAVFVTLSIFGLPVPMFVSIRDIRPGHQLAVDYGKSYRTS